MVRMIDNHLARHHACIENLVRLYRRVKQYRFPIDKLVPSIFFVKFAVRYQTDELIKISSRYHRRKLTNLSPSKHQKNLQSTYENIQAGKQATDSFSVAKLAAQGWNYSASKIKLQKAFSASKKRPLSEGRPMKHENEYLLKALCDHHLKFYKKLPTCAWNEYLDSYQGQGFEFMYSAWTLITGCFTDPKTFGRYLVEELKCRRLILKNKNC